MTLIEGIWIIVKALWWIPLPFLGMKAVYMIAVSWGKLRNMK